jgi:hypothetical protein
MLNAALFGAIATVGNAAPPDLPVLIDGLQDWVSIRVC